MKQLTQSLWQCLCLSTDQSRILKVSHHCPSYPPSSRHPTTLGSHLVIPPSCHEPYFGMKLCRAVFHMLSSASVSPALTPVSLADNSTKKQGTPNGLSHGQQLYPLYMGATPSVSILRSAPIRANFGT